MTDPTRAPTQAMIHRLIDLACRAPSTHNTQPWRWRVLGDLSVELWADRDRQLAVADVDGRNLAISCGAALHHFIAAGYAMGASSAVELLPSTTETDLFAVIRTTAGRPPPAGIDAAQTLEAIERRRTDRRRFTTWPIPEARLSGLSQAAQAWGVQAFPVTDASARFRTEMLLRRALIAQRSDRRFVREQEEWTVHSTDDEVSSPNADPHSPAAPDPISRFEPGSDESSAALVQSSDGLLGVGTTADDQRAWLKSGQALSAVWLHATLGGLSVVPLSQVIEVAETRASLHYDVFAGRAHPQVLLRVGWQEIGRASLSPSRRRPLAEVLLP